MIVAADVDQGPRVDHHVAVLGPGLSLLFKKLFNWIYLAIFYHFQIVTTKTFRTFHSKVF